MFSHMTVKELVTDKFYFSNSHCDFKWRFENYVGI